MSPAVKDPDFDGRDDVAHETAQPVPTTAATLPDAAMEALFVTNRDGCIIYVSDGFSRLTGYSREEAIGRSARMLRSDRTDERLFVDMWHRITAGEPWHGEVVNRRRDGSLYTAELTILPVFDPGGHIVSYTASQRPLGAVARTAGATAGQTLPARDRAMAALAHEIRQPLHIILGYADLLADHVQDIPASEPRVFAERILQTTSYLARLVDDMLDLARAGIGGLPLRQEPFDATALTREVGEAYLPAATAKGLTLQCVTPRAALDLVSDPVRVRQILSNLADNAVKYTARGTVTLRVEGRGDEILFSVHDTGIGIPAEDLRRAFLEFERLEAAVAQGEAGWGIGLSLVRRLVDLLGGHIEAQSAPGQGSRFAVRLPRTPTAPRRVYAA